jgi:AbrB family looped-hinge helix DNA binding protein
MASRHAAMEYLTTTKIGEKGQLTVPKQFRKELGLGTGAPFAVLRLGDGLCFCSSRSALSASVNKSERL